MKDRRKQDDLITGRRLPPTNTGPIFTWEEYDKQFTLDKLRGGPKPHKCPVCDGKGQCYNSPSDGPAVLYEIYKTCHGCGGRGWVTV